MKNYIPSADRAQVLVQALPYIDRYHGKIVVVKYGGNAMINEKLQQQVMEDLVLLRLVGVQVVLVHGGGPEISAVMKKMGKEPVFVEGLRVTDKETMDIVQMALVGKVNSTLVSLVEKHGGRALGLSGADGLLLEAKQRDPRLGFVGDVTEVHPQPILDLLEKGYIPVVSTLGCDRGGSLYNINGDTAAACIAGALRAERLLLMTDVPGILRDKNDPESLLPDLTVDEARQARADGILAGGMIPKVDCAVQALEAGVENVVILDGRVPHALLLELLTDEGAGTLLRKDF
ncbi:MAG: acetylglutamate kinase [Succiniclasticum sp.]|jgi:acetylglutamate kinase|nr:acetylglutamate kinase [Succiniclasticum sp.]MCI6223236.1 acetylglutamate kinase [Selenomonadales bacterium]MDY2869587.1 acetylglutamate kinase [Succiniclasticum sp.]MDY6304278.1 acetylglutamate kinase [Succiniclasticum sp.]